MEMTFNKRVVKVHVVGHKNVSLKNSIDLFRNIFKAWRILHHFVADSCKSLNVLWYYLAWIYQRFKLLYYILSIKNLYRYFNDAVRSRITASGFYIYNCIHHSKYI